MAAVAGVRGDTAARAPAATTARSAKLRNIVLCGCAGSSGLPRTALSAREGGGRLRPTRRSRARCARGAEARWAERAVVKSDCVRRLVRRERSRPTRPTKTFRGLARRPTRSSCQCDVVHAWLIIRAIDERNLDEDWRAKEVVNTRLTDALACQFAGRARFERGRVVCER